MYDLIILHIGHKDKLEYNKWLKIEDNKQFHSLLYKNSINLLYFQSIEGIMVGMAHKYFHHYIPNNYQGMLLGIHYQSRNSFVPKHFYIVGNLLKKYYTKHKIHGKKHMIM